MVTGMESFVCLSPCVIACWLLTKMEKKVMLSLLLIYGNSSDYSGKTTWCILNHQNGIASSRGISI